MSDEKDYKGKKGDDDYKPLKFYEERITGVESGFDRFSEENEHYFTYNINGKVILISEGYTAVKGRENGINSVEKNRFIESRYKFDQLSSGKHYFNLIAGNHQEIGTSLWFDSEEDMLAAVSVLQGKTEDLIGTAASVMSATIPTDESDLSSTDTAEKETVASTPTAEKVTPVIVEEKEQKANPIWWLLPILLGLLAWWLISTFCASCCDKDQTNNQPLGNFISSDLPTGVNLNIPEFGIENKFLSLIVSDRDSDEPTWIDFDRINFETGSADLSISSQEQISNMAEILTAYPDISIKIGGYTDNTGSDEINLTISQQRADSVRNALIGKGIEESRLEAEGYGSQHPIATNDTEEGRAKNRRIAVRILD